MLICLNLPAPLLATTAKAEDVFLMEALWTHFVPHYQYVLKLIEKKKYGKIKSLTADFGFKAPYDENKRLFNKDLGGGSLLDIGIYPVFAAMTLIGMPDKIASAIPPSDSVSEICRLALSASCRVNCSIR